MGQVPNSNNNYYYLLDNNLHQSITCATVAGSVLRSAWQPHSTTGASGRCLRTSDDHLFFTLYRETGSAIL